MPDMVSLFGISANAHDSATIWNRRTRIDIPGRQTVALTGQRLMEKSRYGGCQIVMWLRTRVYDCSSSRSFSIGDNFAVTCVV